MTTLQEKRHRETINSISHVTAQRDACLERIVKLEIKLKDLRRLEARQAKALARPKPAPAPTPAPAPATQPVATPAPPSGDAGEPGVPLFLDRAKQAEAKDAAARERIAAEQAATKKAKTHTRLEKMKVRQEVKHAQLTGQTRKMPLTGRAAMEFIRKG
jgi:hypothetical protein